MPGDPAAMFRLMSKIIKTSNPVPRWSPLGLPVYARQHIAPVRPTASDTANNICYNRPEPRIERKLGKYEDHFFETGREKGWGHIRKCVVIRSEKELPPEQIRRALENLQKRHAILRMAVTSKDGENYFAEVPDAPDFEILQSTDRRAVIASDEQGEWFTYGELLWRSKLLTPENTGRGFLYPFIFTYHACIFDGKSMNGNVIPDLVAYLEASFDQEGEDNIESQPMLPAREQILDQYPDVQRNQIASNDWTSHKAIAVKLHQVHKPSHPQRCSGLACFVLDKKQTSQLQQKVAQRGDISLNGVCVAAHAIALYRLLIDLGILTDDKGWSLESPFAVDLRPYTKPPTPASHSGVCVGELSNNITIPPNMGGCNSSEVLWELAASIKKENRKLLADSKALLANIKYFSEIWYNKFQLDREAFYRDCDPVQDLYYISMAANYTIPPGKGSVRFDHVDLSIGTREPLMFCHSIHRLNSSCLLQWELSYSKMLVSDELAEIHLSLIKKELERCVMD